MEDRSKPVYAISFAGVLAVALALGYVWVATAQAAPEKSNGAAAPTKKAEWVTRCDRLNQAARFDCLDKLRAEARERFLAPEVKIAAAPSGARTIAK